MPAPPSPNLAAAALLDAEDLEQQAAAEDLPAYRRARKRTVHKFVLKRDRDAAAWLTLRVASLAPSSKMLPLFLGNKPIKGNVEIDLDKPQNVLSVDISIRGRLISWSIPAKFPEKWDNEGFVLVSQNLWKADEPSQKPTFMDRFIQREGSELEGKHKFEYALALPDTVIIPSGADAKEYHLPPSLHDKSLNVNIIYELTLTVKRGGSFGSPTTLSTQISYAPFIRPDPFPLLRQSLYDMGVGQLIGPHEDPSGWHELDPVLITGRLFGKRDITISCTLSLAKPLQYTRGSFIPLCLTLDGEDEHALDLLAIPTAPVVDLLALTELRPQRAHARKFSMQADSPRPPDVVPVQSAVWWTDAASRGRARQRRLFGELHLRSSATPPFATPELRLAYRVGLFAFSTPGFVPADDGGALADPQTGALQSADVEIVTGHARGHKTPAVSVTPPTYKKLREHARLGGLAAAFLA